MASRVLGLVDVALTQTREAAAPKASESFIGGTQAIQGADSEKAEP